MLIGKKVILEEVDPSSLEKFREWRNDSNLRRFFREYRYITKDMQEQWYKTRGNNTDDRHVYFQIMEYKDERCQEKQDPHARMLIGCCGLHYINWRIRSAEFGVFLGESRGGGKGKEALMLLFDYGFKELNLHKVWAEVYDSNNAVEIYRHIGFKDDGILRDNQFCEGKYINSYMISMLEDEWREKYGDKPLWKVDEI